MNPLVELKRRLPFTLPQKISSKHIDSTQQMMRSKGNKKIYIKTKTENIKQSDRIKATHNSGNSKGNCFKLFY